MLRSQEEQIENFMQQFSEAFYEGSPPITPPKNWREVFNLLTRAIKTIPKSKKDKCRAVIHNLWTFESLWRHRLPR